MPKVDLSSSEVPNGEGIKVNSNESMTPAETNAWLVGQYVMAEALIKAYSAGGDLDATLNECLKQIGEASRDAGNMTLFFANLGLRQEFNSSLRARLTNA